MTLVKSYQTQWRADAGQGPVFEPFEIDMALGRVRETAFVVQDPVSGRMGLGLGGETTPPIPASIPAPTEGSGPVFPLLAMLAPIYPEWLGDRGFGEVHGTRFPYVTGAMANGIASTRMVAAVAKSGFLGFFGAAGLPLDRVEAALNELQSELDPDGRPWGANLIYSPNEPDLEEAVADLYIRRGVHRVSAAAYMALTPAIVRFACSGLRRAPSGKILRTNHVFAKISRPEIARHFLEPAPTNILDALVARGQLNAEEADLAARAPLAEDITVESDSGGHTDNRPLAALFPSILALRDEMTRKHGYDRQVRVGAAGGLGTPSAVAAAFALGAAYVLTGSVNQACVESGLNVAGRQMLTQAGLADVVMAPAADMFEMGVEVQVLQRGTMFGARAKKLYELYRRHDSLSEISAEERENVERYILKTSFSEAWNATKEFWSSRDPAQVDRAEEDPKHLMALVFRSYLGQASRWAISGEMDRSMDYQIWCGPAMGAFNSWVKGSFLEAPANRRVVQVALNLMEGAAVATRAQQLRASGLPVSATSFNFRPRPLD